MRRCLTASLAAMVLLALLLPAGAQDAVPLDPRVRVGFPSAPPPPLPPGPPVANPQAGGAAHTVQIPLQQGWNVVILPLASVHSAAGFPRHLLLVAGSRWLPLDPVHDPASLDPGRAYLTWADQPITVQVSGQPNQGQAFSTRLLAGWNILGCPSARPIPLERTSITVAGGCTLAFADALSPSPSPGQGWLYSGGRQFVGGQVQDLDLATPGLALSQGRVVGVFSWADCELNWNTGQKEAAPRLDRVDPNPVHPGQVVTLHGRGFGPRGAGMITVEGKPVDPDRVVSWADTSIVAHVPNQVEPGRTGRVAVLVNRVPSNAVTIKVVPRPADPGSPAAPAGGGGGSGSGVLTGRVEDSSGTGLAGAQVWLDEGEVVVSGKDGSFKFEGVEPGQYVVYVSRPGYREGQGKVQIQAGQTRKLLVSLSSADGKPSSAEKKTTLTVRARKYGPLRPKKIEVWEYGNTSRRWTNTWWTDVGDSTVELPCKGVLVGRTYHVNVDWVDKSGNERRGSWEPKVWKEDQTETYEHP